jgi:hypothetical protein
MMKNYMTTGALTKSKKLEGDPMGKATTPFPWEEVVMSIYGGHIPHESLRKLKLTSWAVNTVSPATLEYICWSESPITIDQTDHLDNISKPGRFPLTVDPLVGMTRLTKALMDGGIGLNLMYLDTFEGQGLTQYQVKRPPHPFYKVVLGKHYVPLRWVTLHVTFGDESNYHTEILALSWLTSPVHTMLS